MPANIAVIITAAGFSRRFADGVRSKLDEDLGGRPLVQRTVELFTRDPSASELVASIIVAGPHDPEALAEFRLRHGDRMTLLGATICAGGKTHRLETVSAALEHVPDEATHIAVHDAARPCTPTWLIERLFRLCQSCEAVVPALPLSDTIKRAGSAVDLDGAGDAVSAILGGQGIERGREVIETLDRRGLFAVQTPQVFEADLLRRAYANAGNLESAAITDDAMLVESLGEQVVLIEGDASNIKVTHEPDITIARALLGFKAPAGRPTHKKF